jgi:hypothetical protein
MEILEILSYYYNDLNKRQNSLYAWTDPEVSRSLRLPEFVDKRHINPYPANVENMVSS